MFSAPVICKIPHMEKLSPQTKVLSKDSLERSGNQLQSLFFFFHQAPFSGPAFIFKSTQHPHKQNKQLPQPMLLLLVQTSSLPPPPHPCFLQRFPLAILHASAGGGDALSFISTVVWLHTFPLSLSTLPLSHSPWATDSNQEN